MPIFSFTSGKLSKLPNPTATLNPYRIFADGLGLNIDFHSWISQAGNASNRGIFRAGAMNSRRYHLQFPMQGGAPYLKFQYAVIASWEQGDPTLTGSPVAYDPMDFPSDANCEEAFFIHTDSSESDMFNDGAGNLGGSFKAAIEIFDWQGGIVSGYGVPNEIERIIFNADFLPSGTYEITQAQLWGIAQDGSANSSVFMVEVNACVPQASGDNEYWIIVEAAGEHGDSYDQGFPAPYPAGARRASFRHTTVTVLTEPPNIIYVDDSNTSGIENGSMTYPYSTIQAGIDAAPEGYEIWVDDSGAPYVENIFMKSDVILLSVNWDASDGTNRALIDPPNDTGIWPVKFEDADNAWLEGFQIGFAGTNTSAIYSDMIRLDNSDNCTIIDCLFTGKTDVRALNGVNAINCQNLTIAHCRFDDIDKDTADNALSYFYMIKADNCPGIVVRNNIFTNIRTSKDTTGKQFSMTDIRNTTGIVLKNNLFHHLKPSSMGDNHLMGYGFYFHTCTNIEVYNNTVDNIDVTDAFFIQQVFCFWFDTCNNETFTNNIITRVYSVGFPPVLGRGVDSHNGDVVTLEYTDIWSTVVAYYGNVVPGVGYIEADPQYIDPDSEEYDLKPTSPALAGDPSITDWDDDGTGGSRMGCHGGPGGEKIGLLTPW